MRRAFAKLETRNPSLEEDTGSEDERARGYGGMVTSHNERFCPIALLLLAVCVLCFPLLQGCSKISPPANYYQQVLEIEEQGEQARRDTGRRPGEVVTPVGDSKPTKAAKSSEYRLTPDDSQEQAEEAPVAVEQEEIPEKPPQREIIQESLPPEPIAIASDVVKSALNAADLGISARTVELLNGRLSGGKNSVRVYFTPESVDVINDRFGAICAVVYYLNKETRTIDVVAGIAEDEKSNLIAVLQSSIDDIAAWMTNEITKTEWYSRITRKIL